VGRGYRAVDGRPGELHGAVGPGEGDHSVGSDPKSPAAFVHEVVMTGTEWEKIPQIGRPELLPPVDVVDLAPVERHVAPGEPAGAVHRPQRPPLRSIGEALGATLVDDLPVAVENSGEDLGLAAEPTNGGGRQHGAVGRLARRMLVQATAQGVPIDEHSDLGHPLADRSGPGQQLDQRLGGIPVPAVRTATATRRLIRWGLLASLAA
jgi:hypothetical protein